LLTTPSSTPPGPVPFGDKPAANVTPILKIGLANVKNFFCNRNESGFEIVAMCAAAVYAGLGHYAEMAIFLSVHAIAATPANELSGPLLGQFFGRHVLRSV
jgi:hypothetical protein